MKIEITDTPENIGRMITSIIPCTYWIEEEDKITDYPNNLCVYRCSRCKKGLARSKLNFCPACGAKMKANAYDYSHSYVINETFR